MLAGVYEPPGFLTRISFPLNFIYFFIFFFRYDQQAIIG